MNKDSDWTVICITFCEDEVLFLKRNQEPLEWGPPSGHIHNGESFIDGLKREMLEETSLDCNPILPVSLWQGEHRGQDVTNLTYVCEVFSKDVILSEEHSDYKWIKIDQLDDWQKETRLPLDAWDLFIRFAKEYKLNHTESI